MTTDTATGPLYSVLFARAMPPVSRTLTRVKNPDARPGPARYHAGQMNRAPLLALTAALSFTLPGCAPAPQAQPVEVWTGQAQVLLTTQRYRLTYTVNPETHDLRGTLENVTSRDRFLVEGTALPVRGGAEVTMFITAQDGVRLNASILGFGFSNLALKSNAVLSARQEGSRMTGRLNVNGIGYPISFTRSFLDRP